MSRSNDIAGLTTSILDGVTATEVGLGNVTNESKATMFASPTFTGTTNISSGATFPANPTITLGSNATFPAGHVLQVQQNYVTNSNITVTSTENLSNITNNYYTFAWGVDITTIKANSKIALIGHLGNAHLASGQSNSEVNLSILRYKGGSKEAFVGGSQAGYSSGGPSYGLSRMTSINNGEKAPAISFLDAPADPAGTVLQYRFACMTLSGGFNIQAGTSSSLMAMEIAV